MSIMEWMFGQAETPQERMMRVLRDEQRNMRKAILKIDRQVRTMENEIPRIEKRIEAAARKGQMRQVKSHAKSVVRKNASVSRLIDTKTKLEGVGDMLTDVSSQQAIGSAMGAAVRSLIMTRTMVPGGSLQRLLAVFQRETMMADINAEMLEETLTDGLEDASEEEDDLVNGVLAKIGVELDEKLGTVSIPSDTRDKEPAEGRAVDAALLERFKDLRG